MWRYKLQTLLSVAPAPLTLDANSQGFQGKYLWIQDEPFALGQFIGEGDEAQVFELIKLRQGVFNDVVKICKYAPSHTKYKKWANSVRDEVNPYSILPNVEQTPAHLIPVEGGVVKVQPYLSPTPEVDWRSAYPVFPILEMIRAGDLVGAILRCNEMLERHGNKGIILEQKGICLAMLGRLEDARATLEQSLGAHTAEGNSSRLFVAYNLATLLMRLHEAEVDNLPGMMTIQLEGLTFRQQILEAGPPTYDLSDQAVEVLIDCLVLEPYYVQALLLLARILRGGGESQSMAAIAQAVDHIDPSTFHKSSLQAFRDYATRAAKPAEIGDVPEIPPHVAELLRQYDKQYAPPIPEKAAQAESFYNSATFYADQGEFERAEEAIQKAIVLEPNELRYVLALCRFDCEEDRWECAYHRLQKVICDFTDDYRGYEAQGRVCNQLKRYRESCINFHKALACTPPKADAALIMARLGDSYRLFGQRESAFKNLRAAFATDPFEPLVVLFLVRALRDEVVREQEQGNIEGRDRYIKEIVETLDEAELRGVRSPDFGVLRAQILIASGQLKEAIGPLEKALSMDPTHQIAATILAKLKSHFPNG